MKYRLWCVAGALVLLVTLGSCGVAPPTTPLVATPSQSFLQPPPAFKESNLIGRWELLAPSDSTETLLLTDDQRFIHTYEVGDPVQRLEERGTWWVEHRASGCVYVHLEGMRYFHGGGVLAENGNRISPNGTLHTFVEICENRTITMPDQVILTVANHPRLPRGIELLFPRSGRDNTDVSLWLTADATGQLLPSLTP